MGQARVLGLIAGSGRLPFEVIEAAGDRGRKLAIVAIENNTDPAIETCEHVAFVWIAAGELERLIEFLKSSGARDVILAGAVAKREMFRDLASLRPDARALAVLSSLSDRGDDALLCAVARELEKEGLRIVESTAHLADRLTPEGTLTRSPLDPALERDLFLGARVAKTLGTHDVGQSVVVKQGIVLAVEAVEGTDAAILRGSELGGDGAVVVKVAKPHQDLRFDLPAIGPETISLAERCKISAIGLEAGRSIVLERERTLGAAIRAGIAVVGLRVEAE